MKKCSYAGCRKKAYKTHSLCNHHRREREKEKDGGLHRAFLNLRGNAKRRGKEFLLTYEDFKVFAQHANFRLRGRTSQSYHIDRIDDTKGYTIDNIQLITNAENVRKENERRKIEKYIRYDWQSKEAQTITIIPRTEQPNDCPF